MACQNEAHALGERCFRLTTANHEIGTHLSKVINCLQWNGMAKISDHGNTLDPHNAAHNAKVSPNYNPLNQAVPFGGTVLYMAPESLAGHYHKNLEKKCTNVSEAYAMSEVIPKFDSTGEKYEADFALFKQNCDGRFSENLVDAVIASFTLDPKDRRESITSMMSVDPKEMQNFTAASALLQLIKAELK